MRLFELFCPPNQNPFPLTCQKGKCQIPPPCAVDTCFETQFNSQSVPAGTDIFLIASFKPKFSGSFVGVAFTNATVSLNGVKVAAAPNSYVELESSLTSCSTAKYTNNEWQTIAPLPGSGNTFLSAVSIPVPNGKNYKNAKVSWCGNIEAPGEIDVQISAAIYSSCTENEAAPEACETHTKYHAGVPTGCPSKLQPGGTGGGGSNYGGSQSARYAVWKSN